MCMAFVHDIECDESYGRNIRFIFISGRKLYLYAKLSIKSKVREYEIFIDFIFLFFLHFVHCVRTYLYFSMTYYISKIVEVSQMSLQYIVYYVYIILFMNIYEFFYCYHKIY